MGWRRRYCPSPLFIAFLVALCVFYQCLSLFWKSTPWTKEINIRRSLGLLDVAAKNKKCLNTWNNVVAKIKEYEERFKKKLLSSPKERVLLLHTIDIEGSQLYARVLTKLGYMIYHFTDTDSIKTFITYNQKTLGRDAFLLFPLNESTMATCKEKQELLNFKQPGKVKLLPQIQQILCIKDEICQLAAHFPELQNLSLCTHHPGKSWNRKITSDAFISEKGKKKNQYLTSPGINQLLESPYQNARPYQPHDHLPFQDIPVIRTFVVITSLSPLHAFIHSMALLQTGPEKPFAPIELQKFYQHFLKSKSPLQAFNALKEMISKLLLTVEVISEAAAAGDNPLNRCSECFQLLSIDIGYSSISHPSVLEVKEQLVLNDLNVDCYATMETVLEDTFNLLFQNHLFVFLDALEKVKHCLTLKKTCWIDSILAFTWEQMDNLSSLLQEQTKLEKFEMIYPSNSVILKALRHELYHRVDQMENLRSILTLHDFLSDLCECLQSLEELNLTNRYVTCKLRFSVLENKTMLKMYKLSLADYKGSLKGL
ncbi:hypothetical protein GDO81_010203 [Engystomops pustulosus]|uniref:Uncharacterized protein n=1 Tax=Engystomops pustulosus TaxID=76066 RepID=A0AAV7BXZ2_ENGPU|nr:hypothetical protein GDO81_010203 [Engystomops pustulosus]